MMMREGKGIRERWGNKEASRGERKSGSASEQCSCPAGIEKTTAGPCTAVLGVEPVTSA